MNSEVNNTALQKTVALVNKNAAVKRITGRFGNRYMVKCSENRFTEEFQLCS